MVLGQSIIMMLFLAVTLPSRSLLWRHLATWSGHACLLLQRLALLRDAQFLPDPLRVWPSATNRVHKPPILASFLSAAKEGVLHDIHLSQPGGSI
eukprot:6214724-Pleurochrysis_carterae.AAC.1